MVSFFVPSIFNGNKNFSSSGRRMNKIPFFRLNRELWDTVDDGKNPWNHQVTGQTKGTHDEIRGKAERNPFCMIIIFNFLFFFFRFVVPLARFIGSTAIILTLHNSPRNTWDFFSRQKLFPSWLRFSSLRIHFEPLQLDFLVKKGMAINELFGIEFFPLNLRNKNHWSLQNLRLGNCFPKTRKSCQKPSRTSPVPHTFSSDKRPTASARKNCFYQFFTQEIRRGRLCSARRQDWINIWWELIVFKSDLGVINHNDTVIAAFLLAQHLPVIFRWWLHAADGSKLVDADDEAPPIFRLLTADGFWMIIDVALILWVIGQIFSHPPNNG